MTLHLKWAQEERDMCSRWIRTLGLALAASCAAADAAADPDDKGFSAHDRAAIVAYYGEPQTRHPGRGRGAAHARKPLPPGIARNLARGKPLPPGLVTRPVPRELLHRIHVPRGCEVVWVDGRVLLVELATRLVRDVIEDVVYR
jgi:hypothetical protein